MTTTPSSDYINQLEETIQNLQSTLDSTVKQMDTMRMLLPEWSKAILHTSTRKRRNMWLLSYKGKIENRGQMGNQFGDDRHPVRIDELETDEYEVRIYGFEINKKWKTLNEAVEFSLRLLYGPEFPLDMCKPK